MSKKEKMKTSKNPPQRPYGSQTKPTKGRLSVGNAATLKKPDLKKEKSFNFSDHNKKVSKARGPEWKKKLTKGKFESFNNPSVIRSKRSELGLSQKEVIAGTPIRSLTAFGRIEKGKAPADQKSAALIAKKLKVSITTLFKETKEKDLVARFGAK